MKKQKVNEKRRGKRDGRRRDARASRERATVFRLLPRSSGGGTVGGRRGRSTVRRVTGMQRIFSGGSSLSFMQGKSTLPARRGELFPDCAGGPFLLLFKFEDGKVARERTRTYAGEQGQMNWMSLPLSGMDAEGGERERERGRERGAVFPRVGHEASSVLQITKMAG